MLRLAAVDIGSNSSLLLIVEGNDSGQLRVLVDTKASTRLSAGAAAGGVITPEALARQIAVLDKFAAIIKDFEVSEVHACGTQVFRSATNGPVLATLIAKQYDWTMEIISGAHEAELSYRAAATGLTNVPERRIVLDVGGGSSEVIFGARDRIERSKSFAIGAVNLTESCGLDTLLTEAKRASALEHMADAFTGLDRMGRPAFNAQVIAVGGTATTLGAMSLNLTEFDPDRVHGTMLSRVWIEEQIAHLGAISSLGRSKYMPFDPDRAEIIVGGALILHYLLRQFAFEKLTVSNRGLRWGLILAALAARIG